MHRLRQLAILVALLPILGGGCRPIPVYEQHLVGKPCMQFSDSPVFAYGSRALTQIEPGFATSGGSQVTTCSACK